MIITYSFPITRQFDPFNRYNVLNNARENRLQIIVVQLYVQAGSSNVSIRKEVYYNKYVSRCLCENTRVSVCVNKYKILYQLIFVPETFFFFFNDRLLLVLSHVFLLPGNNKIPVAILVFIGVSILSEQTGTYLWNIVIIYLMPNLIHPGE